MITLEQLRQFLVVAQLKSFTKAADVLYVSHSTISRNVSFLEQELGVPLMIRDTRTISLTYAGYLLYEKGTLLMHQLEEMEHAVQMAGNGINGILTVSSISYYIEPLFQAYRQFHVIHPDVNLMINQHQLETIMQNVLYDQADLGITFSYTLGETSDQFDTIPITHGRFCILAADSYDKEKLYHYAHTGKIDVPILTLSRLSYEFVENLGKCSVYNKLTQDECKSVSLESMLLQIRAGIGIAILPHHVALEYSAGCQIVDLLGEDSAYDIVMFYKKDNTNPTLSLFLDVYRAIKADTDID